MGRVVEIQVRRMDENCKRTTYFVCLVSDEGFTKEVDSFRSHSIYDDMNGTKGLPIEEARDRALTSAANWGDFLQIEPTPFVDEGEIRTPRMTFDTYTMQREEAAEDAAREAAA